MKKLYKIMLSAFFIFSCFIPLSVSAEEYTPDDVDWSFMPFSITDGTLSYAYSLSCSQFEIFDNWRQSVNISSSIGFYYSAIDCLYIFTSISNFQYGAITGSGYTFDFNSDGSLNEILSYSGTFYPSAADVDCQWSDVSSSLLPGINNPNQVTLSSYLNYYNNSCTVSPTPTPTATPTPTPIPDSDWSVDFNEILSNPYISQLVGYAYDNNISAWHIKFSIYRTPNGNSGYTISSLGYQYSYRLYNSSNQLLSSVIFYEVSGEECSTNTPTYCRPYASYTVEVESEIILKSSWLVVSESGPIEVVDPSGNDLIENGNSSTQSASSSIDSITSSLDSSATQYEQFESQFNSSLTSSLDNIDVNSINFVNSNDFVKTASWVKIQFDDILDSSGIYKTAISFVLIIGLALLLLGRRL